MWILFMLRSCVPWACFSSCRHLMTELGTLISAWGRGVCWLFTCGNLSYPNLLSVWKKNSENLKNTTATCGNCGLSHDHKSATFSCRRHCLWWRMKIKKKKISASRAAFLVSSPTMVNEPPPKKRAKPPKLDLCVQLFWYKSTGTILHWKILCTASKAQGGVLSFHGNATSFLAALLVFAIALWMWVLVGSRHCCHAENGVREIVKYLSPMADCRAEVRKRWTSDDTSWKIKQVSKLVAHLLQWM